MCGTFVQKFVTWADKASRKLLFAVETPEIRRFIDYLFPNNYNKSNQLDFLHERLGQRSLPKYYKLRDVGTRSAGLSFFRRKTHKETKRGRRLLVYSLK